MSRGMRAVLGLFVGIGLLAVPSTGAVRLRESTGEIVKWNLSVPLQPNVVDGKLTYYLEPLGSKDVPTGIDELVAVRQAFQTWEDVETAGIAFTEDRTRIALKQDSTDRVNLLRWETGTIGPFTLALTYPFSSAGVMMCRSRSAMHCSGLSIQAMSWWLEETMWISLPGTDESARASRFRVSSGS